MPPTIVCITADRVLARVLRRTLGPLHAQVSFVDDIGAWLPLAAAEPDLVIADVDAAGARTLRDSLTALGWSVRVLAIAEWERQHDALAVLDLCRCNHLVARTDALDETALLATAQKLLGGADIFGLEKYLAWGAPIRERSVSSYDDKRLAIEAVSDFARRAGCRRRMVGRIEVVLDELLMNALYDAPAAQTGDRSPFLARATPGAGPVSPNAVSLRYACDGRHLAVSVRDAFGALARQTILSHLSRAVALSGTPLSSAHQGAGLGLYFVLSSVSRFVVNVLPGKSTEVICLFDLRQTGRRATPMASSFHIFTAAEPPPAAAPPAG